VNLAAQADAKRAADPADIADAAARCRAARLVRWYPGSWRERYAEEFTELLVSDIAERPKSLARTLDVARGGLLARLTGAGLAGFGSGGRARHAAASLGTLGAASAVFLIVAAAQWSQLLISWVWAARLRQRFPASAPHVLAADRNATLGASVAVLALLAVSLLAALPVIATVAARLARPGTPGERGRLAWPALMLVAALAVLIIGGRSLENNWVGTGGLHSPVPGGLAAFTWAVTIFVSAYWAHPGMLAAFPAAERAWMAASPVVLAITIVAAVLLVRRAALTSCVIRFEARLGLACCTLMTAFVALCAGWLSADGPLSGHPTMFHGGWINVASTAILAVALAAAVQAARTANRALSGRQG
jgi:hypothetical protein